MPSDGQKSSAVRELESLRIARAEAPKRRSRLVPAAITLVVLAILGGIGYEVYLRTLGRPIEVQTAMVTVRSAGQPGVMLTGSGYVVTQHKYISVGDQRRRHHRVGTDRGRSDREEGRPAREN